MKLYPSKEDLYSKDAHKSRKIIGWALIISHVSALIAAVTYLIISVAKG